MIVDVLLELWIGFVLKMEFFWKMIKWDELRWILEFIGIGSWYIYVYATALICELWMYLVEAFELGYFDFGGIKKMLVFINIDELCQINTLWSINL